MTLGVAVQPSEVKTERNWTMDGLGRVGGGKNAELAYYVCMYLLDKNPPSLEGKIMRDFKEGKAYSYFASFWLGRHLFHLLGESCLKFKMYLILE